MSSAHVTKGKTSISSSSQEKTISSALETTTTKMMKKKMKKESGKGSTANPRAKKSLLGSRGDGGVGQEEKTANGSRRKMTAFVFTSVMIGAILFVLYDPLGTFGREPTILIGNNEQTVDEAIATEIRMIQDVRLLRTRLKQSERNVELLENRLEEEVERESTGDHGQDAGVGVLKSELALESSWLKECQEREITLQKDVEQKQRVIDSLKDILAKANIEYTLP